MAAIVANPIAVWIFLAMLLGLVVFLGYAWFTRYRENWDELLRRWSTRRDDEPGPGGRPTP